MTYPAVEKVESHSFSIDLYRNLIPESTYYWASMYNQDEYLTGLPIAEGGGDTPDAAMADLFHNVQRTLTFSSIDDSEVNAT